LSLISTSAASCTAVVGSCGPSDGSERKWGSASYSSPAAPIPICIGSEAPA
jgi:hypothetical protein